MKYTSFLFALLLAACQTTPQPTMPVLVPPTTTVSVPDYLLKKCPPFPKLEARQYSESELVDVYSKLITFSEECRAKDSILVDTVRKAFNISSPTQPSK